MSGTSLDGVDIALVSFDEKKPTLVASHYRPYPEELFQSTKSLCRKSNVRFDELALVDVKLGDFYAEGIHQLLSSTDTLTSSITAIGSHGQTIQHSPNSTPPYTLQIGDANRIAENTGITVVADFRRRDMAAGGQGAPLVPAFHKAMFQTNKENLAIINIGGISNVTFLSKDASEPLIGFDCGPGCTLMDQWTQIHFDKPYDASGDLAKQGAVNTPLLDSLLSDSYFESHYPKSTGPEYFSLEWLQNKLQQYPSTQLDTLSTLCELTAASIELSLNQIPGTDKILICGGGSHNTYLKERIKARTKQALTTTETYGIHPDWVEAMAFAWLAKQTMEGKNGNCPSVTGATKEVVLGAIYAANPNQT